MQIGGYQKLTLIDFPEKLATTVFTVGCSLRCPFCHNPELVTGSISGADNVLEKEFFEFLEKRKGKLDGVCITGGEPLIQNGIIDFIGKINKMGFAVKLDTNGTRPDVLRKIIALGIIDYIAMDIKSSPKSYDKLVGMKTDLKRIDLSIDIIMNSGIDYEFRTTAVPGLHSEKDFLDIAKWINGSKKYYLQEYRDLRILDKNLGKKTKGKSLNLEKIKKNIEKNFDSVGIRK